MKMTRLLLAAVALAALAPGVALAQSIPSFNPAAMSPNPLPTPQAGLDQVPAPAPNPTNQGQTELMTQSIQVAGGTLLITTLYQGRQNGGAGQPVAVTQTFVPTPQLGLRLGSPQLSQWSTACNCFLAPNH